MQEYKYTGEFMKKFIKSLVLVLLVCTSLLAGCGKQGFKDNPATNDVVIGNGGYAVQKGDYLYYVNGYIDNYKTTLQNNPELNKGNAVLGAIYRTKLVNDKVQYDENGFVKCTERVVGDVVGFENGSFYIVDDYIYYITPHMNEDTSGTIRTDYTNFYRVNVNGLERENLYVSRTTGVVDWNAYKIDGKTYLVIIEKSTDANGNTTNNIVRVDGKSGKAKTLVEGVDTAVLNGNNFIDISEGKEYNGFVYYTITDDKKVNKLGKVNIITGETETYEPFSQATYSLIDFKNDSLYLTITLSNSTKLNRIALNTNENLTNAEYVELTKTSYTSYYTIEGVLNKLVVVDSSNVMYYLNNGVSERVLLTSAVTVVGLNNNCVFYIENSLLKCLDYTVDNATSETLGSTNKTYLLSLASQVDFNSGKVYLFASYTPESSTTSDSSSGNYYLNYISLFDKENSKFVGAFAEGHTPEKPSDEEIADGEIWIK